MFLLFIARAFQLNLQETCKFNFSLGSCMLRILEYVGFNLKEIKKQAI